MADYTASEINAALRARHREMRFGCNLLNKSLVKIGTLAVIDQQVDCNASSETPMSWAASLRAADAAGIDWASDRMQPTASIRMPDGGWAECALGVFAPTSPIDRLHPAHGAVDADGYDLTVVLREDRLESAITIAAGTKYLTAIEAQAQAAGLWRMLLEPSDAELPHDVQFAPGASRLSIINTLLTAINYAPAYADAYGRIVCQRYLYPYDRAVRHEYTDGPDSVILAGPISRERDSFNRPNVIVGIVNRTDAAPLTSKWVNNDPASELSIVRRGRKVVRVDTLDDALDQATLDAYVLREGYAAIAGYEVVGFDTVVMPVHGVGDIIYLQAAGISARYQEMAWSMRLAVNGTMSHTLQRVVLI